MKTFNEKEYDQILSYLSGKASDSEKAVIETLIQSDPNWSNELAKVKETVAIIQHVHYKEKVKSLIGDKPPVPVQSATIMQQLDEWLTTVSQNANRLLQNLFWQPKVILRLAIVTVIIGILSVFGYQQYDSWHERKMARIHQEQQEQELARLREQQRNRVTIEAKDMAQSLINDSIVLVAIPKKLGKIDSGLSSEDTRPKAIRQLEAMGKTPQSTPTDPDKRLYGSGENTPAKPKLTAREEAYRSLLLGIGYVKEGNNKAAVEQLNQIKDSSLTQDVSWYKALAYLQLGKNKEARAELVKITDNRYLKNAKELLTALPQ